MFIRTEHEIVSLMPTARWSRPEQLLGYLEEEERVALEPLLGTPLYNRLCTEYERLRNTYIDITAATITPTAKAKPNPAVPYARVTDRLDDIHAGEIFPDTGSSSSASSSASSSSGSASSSSSGSASSSSSGSPSSASSKGDDENTVPKLDLQTVRLLRICQQIEFYKMLSHKAGLLTVSFNEGGGMNVVTADGYDQADDKHMERVVKDAYMSAGRATDSLLLFLEADAKGDRFFTDLWREADAYYLHRDLLFQTARVLNEYYDIKGDRMAYASMVRDIRFCQNTYLKPRIGSKLLKAIVSYANGLEDAESASSSSSGNSASSSGNSASSSGNSASSTGNSDTDKPTAFEDGTAEELLSLLRTALAFYVEARRVTLTPQKEQLVRREAQTDAQQAMAMACQFVEDNLDSFGDYAVDSPIYKQHKAQEAQAAADAKDQEAARRRHCRAQCEQRHKKLFTAFPSTHRNPPINITSKTTL